jgi:UDP-2,4-diacetamido-2,4,6-trideoxy-beta-L-altropyranose hydrolase
VSRCAVLAQLFKDQGYTTQLIARPSSAFNDRLLTKFDSYSFLSEEQLTLEQDAHETLEFLSQEPGSHILVVDHYKLDHLWEKYFYKDHKIVVIDDLADRPHLGHVLIDNNYRSHYKELYKNLVPTDCELLLGPNYSFLRKEFLAGPFQQERKGVLVFFGGTDPTNETTRFMQALSLRPIDDRTLFQFILSSSHKYLNEVVTLARDLNCSLHIDSEIIPQLMSQSALYFGSGGTITWERMYRGLPGAVVSVADNQTQIAQSLAFDGYQKYWGTCDSINYSHILDQIFDLLNNKTELEILSQKGTGLVRPLELKNLTSLL